VQFTATGPPSHTRRPAPATIGLPHRWLNARAATADGHGHPTDDPKPVLGVLLYGYCLGLGGVRSGVKAAARHPQSAQAVAAHGDATDSHAGHRLNRDQGGAIVAVSKA
jgi:hypothetical protein